MPKTYFVDITVTNHWRNSVICIWPQGLTLTQMVSPSQATTRKIFSISSDYSPQALLLKFADKNTGKSLKVDDMLSVYLKYNQILQPIVFVIDSSGNLFIHFICHSSLF